MYQMLFVKKRGNGRPDIALLRRPVCKAGPGLQSGNLDLEGFLSYAERVAHSASTSYKNTIVSVKYQLSFWESGILVTVREKVPT